MSPTPHDIAQFGHIAALLRKALAQKEWNIPDLSRALGLPRDSATPYKWLNAMGAPAPKYRAKLAKLIGVPEGDLLRREPGSPVTTASVPLLAGPIAKPGGAARTVDPLLFRVTSDGMAQIKLDVTLPMAEATPLLRMLLDAGMVFAPGEAA
jgi:hypothetical protein